MVYWDLNVQWQDGEESKVAIEALVKKSIELGYSGLAWSVISDNPKPPKCTIVPTYSMVKDLSTPQIKLLSEQRTQQTSTEKKRDVVGEFKQYTRLTLEIQSLEGFNTLSSPNSTLHSYDIVAICSSNEKVLHSALSSDIVDIITFDLSEKMPFYLKLPLVNFAVAKGVFFEIGYGGSYQNQMDMNNFFYNLSQILRVTRGRQIIFTSAAQTLYEMRSPQDCVNLGILAGMRPLEAKNAVSNNCVDVLKHAATRKTIKGALQVVDYYTPNSE